MQILKMQKNNLFIAKMNEIFAESQMFMEQDRGLATGIVW
jgi:hypothetical protein